MVYTFKKLNHSIRGSYLIAHIRSASAYFALKNLL